MRARLVTGSTTPDQLDELIQLWRETVVPSVSQQPGFKSARLLVDRATGQVASMGLWETAADVQGSVAWNQGQLTHFTSLFSTPPVVALYEVAAEVT